MRVSSCQLSVISCQVLGGGHRVSGFGYQWSAVRCWAEGIGCQASVVSSRFSVVSPAVALRLPGAPKEEHPNPPPNSDAPTSTQLGARVYDAPWRASCPQGMRRGFARGFSNSVASWSDPGYKPVPA